MHIETKYRLKFKRLLLIFVTFLFAQISVAIYAHDPHADIDTDPDHKICSVCVMAAQTEDNLDIDNDDKDIEPAARHYHLTFPIPLIIPKTRSACPAYRTVLQRNQLRRRNFLSRAPPLKRLSII